jgi:histidine triad (HIT) family protein
VSSDCAFCRFAAGEESDWNRLDDVVWRDESTLAFVAPAWWPNNAGHVIVVPLTHAERLETIDVADLAAVHATAQRVAIAMGTAYGCEATSMRQHNGRAAGQEVPHLHVHVFPRYEDDRLYERTPERRRVTPEERAPYADKLRSVMRGGT